MDTVEFANQLLTESQTGRKHMKLSASRESLANLAEAYLQSLEELRKARNTVKALSHDLEWHKAND